MYKRQVWNSAVTTLLKSQVVKKNEEGDGGFKPLHGQIEKKTEDALTDWEYDEIKLQLLDKTLLMLSQKTRVMVCSSPCYYEEKTSIYLSLIHIWYSNKREKSKGQDKIHHHPFW